MVTPDISGFALVQTRIAVYAPRSSGHDPPATGTVPSASGQGRPGPSFGPGIGGVVGPSTGSIAFRGRSLLADIQPVALLHANHWRNHREFAGPIRRVSATIRSIGSGFPARRARPPGSPVAVGGAAVVKDNVGHVRNRTVSTVSHRFASASPSTVSRVA